MEKLKAGIFDGPQIRKLMQNQTFTACMTMAERAAYCLYSMSQGYEIFKVTQKLGTTGTLWM